MLMTLPVGPSGAADAAGAATVRGYPLTATLSSESFYRPRAALAPSARREADPEMQISARRSLVGKLQRYLTLL